MKVGIDIDKLHISRAVIDELKNEGYYVVNMTLDKNEPVGEEVFKKTILANSAKLDFFLLIKTDSSQKGINVYYKNNILSKNFSVEFINSLKGLGFDNLNIFEGEEFYLIQNVKAPTVIVKINILNKKIQEDELIKSILYCIKCIKGK
ncbi:N-acetylmuramoyl-L-alanine amidase [Clostridium sp. Ade.TY]|uniref:N-acetylmuramoyl-L-alanine amidase n=1 Tax=Clostridium sp. Ade.TY TaxID=1391647 RepID=UPI000428E49F|nr:N-acetylmuramoyl-L-alanine amidase [Clostridium sp. Ade.TY]